jgi:hypothetical protein
MQSIPLHVASLPAFNATLQIIFILSNQRASRPAKERVREKLVSLSIDFHPVWELVSSANKI